MKLRRCYEHSLELDKIVPKLLGQLVGGKLNPTQHLETQQALVKQLAEILEFVLKFDEYKVSKKSRVNHKYLNLSLCLCLCGYNCFGQVWATSNAHNNILRGSTRLCLL